MGEPEARVGPGLTEVEAVRTLAEVGANELPSGRRRTIVSMALDVAREPMFLLLVGCGALYLILGDVDEALMLLGFVFVVMGITFVQERKTERALEALRDLSSPRALVIRDGRRRRVAGREVVPGDLLVLAEGDRVAADAVLLAGANLTLDESLLTGESVPVRKRAWTGSGRPPPAAPGGDDLPFVYSGSLVVQGQGIARVFATASSTQMGKIGRALEALEPERTPLQRETSRLVRLLAVAGLSFCVVVVAVYGFFRADWAGGFLAGIALAMAMLPEEFPVVLTIFLALGAWRISRRRVLTRRVPAIETLGSASVLCVDKTGTLTQNRMAVQRLYADGRSFAVEAEGPEPLPEEFHELLEFGILASEREPFDPMEKAFLAAGEERLSETEHLHDDWRLVRQYPLSEKLLALSHVWKSKDGRQYVTAAKGAPEAVADLCHLEEGAARELAARVEEMAADGLRVLGVAKAEVPPGALPGEQHDFAFRCVGLVGLADPVREGVPAAVRECYAAGIRVVMITGDHPRTARSIAGRVGLRPADEVIVGSELDSMDEAELHSRLERATIFARAAPEQKLRLVNALKERGEVVAMTGDGVNDAPALKAAHIGVAMGGRGTDVAREAAALVLLDDDFSSIVQAVRLGRRIFDNLRKAMSYIVAVHVPIAGLSLLPVLFGWPLVLSPVHILFLELVIDPACSVVFEAEAEESDVMRRPPRRLGEPLFGRALLGLSVLQGGIVLATVLAVFAFAFYGGRGEPEARALTFTTLVTANLALIFTNLSWSRTMMGTLRGRNEALRWVFGGTLAFLALVLYVPFLRRLFRFALLHPADLLVCAGAGLLAVLWFEGLKVLRRGRTVA